jgi:TonB family protein
MPLATAKKERFGKFLFLEQTDQTSLGSEYRAAKLSPTGLEKIVTVLRLAPAISSNAEVAKQLMDQAKVAAQLQNPNVVKIFGIGKVDAHYYISYEFIEGKSLRAIFQRCKNDGFPFSVDHTLLIASKVCSALEYAHARKTETGSRYWHGLVTPANVVVSYEGEVRLRGFGYWPSRVREAGALSEEELLYLSPEQATGAQADPRSDIFAVGAILFESLTGQPLFKGGRTSEIAGRVHKARLQNPTGEDDALPKPIADILLKSLAADPGARYAEVQEMRKAIDTLLFSGDFTPTTFNLAFFMHSLFREEIERESKLLKEEKEASYFEFLAEEPRTPTRVAMPTPVPAAVVTGTPTPVPGAVPRPLPPTAPVAATPLPSPTTPVATPIPTRHTPVPAHSTSATPAHGVPVSRADVHHPEARDHGHREVHAPIAAHEAAPGLTAKEAAAGFTFHKARKGRMPVIVGVAAVVLIGAGVVFFLMRGGLSEPAPPPPAPTTLSAAELEYQEKIRQLQEKERELAAREAQIKEDEARAADEIKKQMEAQAKAKGQQADPAAVAKAQEEAAKKARLEQEKRLEEERRKLEEARLAEEARIAEERRRVEEAERLEAQRKAEEQRRAEEAARAAAATTLPPPPTPAPVKPGSLVNVSEMGVIAPVAVQKPEPPYPEFAKRQRIGGVVELNILVDEKGNVVDTQIVAGTAGKAGLNEAAQQGVRRWKYRPATKDGVPVRTWVPVKVVFTLEK